MNQSVDDNEDMEQKIINEGTNLILPQKEGIITKLAIRVQNMEEE